MSTADRLLALQALQRVRERRVDIRRIQLQSAEQALAQARIALHESVQQAERAQSERRHFESHVFQRLSERPSPQAAVRDAMVRLKALGLNIEASQRQTEAAQRLVDERHLGLQAAQAAVAQSVRSQFKANEMVSRVGQERKREVLRKEDEA